ncbi:hypothetical protein WJX81_001977 [Elliptochloris bilobata]|uniref:Uncharacterized protein n=1 Tax=Elliptochloris bilobata TaxID=381761 RepID=A0AAW1SBK9_9CHLO
MLASLEAAAQLHTYEKGTAVWYRQRDGVYVEAQVLSVDRAVQPPSYAVQSEAASDFGSFCAADGAPGASPHAVPPPLGAVERSPFEEALAFAHAAPPVDEPEDWAWAYDAPPLPAPSSQSLRACLARSAPLPLGLFGEDEGAELRDAPLPVLDGLPTWASAPWPNHLHTEGPAGDMAPEQRPSSLAGEAAITSSTFPDSAPWISEPAATVGTEEPEQRPSLPAGKAALSPAESAPWFSEPALVIIDEEPEQRPSLPAGSPASTPGTPADSALWVTGSMSITGEDAAEPGQQPIESISAAGKDAADFEQRPSSPPRKATGSPYVPAAPSQPVAGNGSAANGHAGQKHSGQANLAGSQHPRPEIQHQTPANQWSGIWQPGRACCRHARQSWRQA